MALEVVLVDPEIGAAERRPRRQRQAWNPDPSGVAGRVGRTGAFRHGRRSPAPHPGSLRYASPCDSRSAVDRMQRPGVTSRACGGQ
jgi:hypothetical protein